MSENALSLSGAEALPAARPLLGRALALFGRAPRSYAVLEARRNLLLYAGWPVVILGSLPLAAAVAMSAEYPLIQGVAAALLGWAVAGLPLTALLFGAVAGAGLRGASEEAEASLPLSPRTRAFGALASAAGALAASTALVAGLILMAAPDAGSLLRAMSEVGSNTWNRTHWEVMFSVLTTLYCTPLALSWLLLVSFGVSLVSAHAVLGGVAALFAGAAALLPVLAGLMLQMSTEGKAEFLFPAAACTSALLAGALAAVAGAAAPALRAGRWGAARALLLALLPLAGSLAAWPALYRSRDRALAATESVVSAWDRSRGGVSRHLVPAIRRSLGGRLVMERPEGDLVLLAGWTPTVADLVWGKRLSEVHQVFWDSKGMLWVEAWHPGTQGAMPSTEIYVGRGDGPLRRYLTLPYQMRFTADDGRACVDPEGWAYDSRTYVYLDPDKPPILKRQ
ncbi:MAG: hypothetical protein HY928_13230 [Elusimicrobia bacterium]|nr:hypothetical protein [Elusimicrobiota bacterium]